MNYIQANTNGQLHDARSVSLAPLNRGFLYGDAVYEVWRSYGRVLFAWGEHWTRLQASAHALAMEIPWTQDFLFAQIKHTVRAFAEKMGNRGEVYVRLQIFRGEGAIGLDPALADEAGYIILVQPVPEITATAWAQGVSLSVGLNLKRNPIDSLSPAWKTGNYLNNLLSLREAKQRGADDVVILNHAGKITEASTSNIGFIRGQCFVTSPVSVGILAGITRQIILQQVATMASLEVKEELTTPADLPAMDECCLLSTTKDVQPVGRIDGGAFAVGENTVSRRLKQAFATYAADYASSHPELAL